MLGLASAVGGPTVRAMRYLVGCMSGTSIDGIDAAFVAIDGHGLDMSVSLLAQASLSFDADLTQRLRRCADQEALTAAEICQLNHDFSAAHQAVISDCLANSPQQPALICVHGQTVFHKPPLSWQMINPAPLARAFSCTVLSDLRAADLAAGGEGAPITPLADYILFHETGSRRSVCNLGGFCNMTHLPADKDVTAINGYDACACNHILNAIAETCLQMPFDRDGAAALQGQVHQQAGQALLALLHSQRHAQKSLGTGDEMQRWLHEWRASVSANDLARTACWAIAACIAGLCNDSDLLICAGGGARNACLMSELNQHRHCVSSDQFDVPVQQREAIAMAVLAACCQDKMPITLSQVTGLSTAAPLAGNWTYHA